VRSLKKNKTQSIFQLTKYGIKLTKPEKLDECKKSFEENLQIWLKEKGKNYEKDSK
jgi:hypothetical protein